MTRHLCHLCHETAGSFIFTPAGPMCLAHRRRTPDRRFNRSPIPGPMPPSHTALLQAAVGHTADPGMGVSFTDPTARLVATGSRSVDLTSALGTVVDQFEQMARERRVS